MVGIFVFQKLTASILKKIMFFDKILIHAVSVTCILFVSDKNLQFIFSIDLKEHNIFNSISHWILFYNKSTYS